MNSPLPEGCIPAETLAGRLGIDLEADKRGRGWQAVENTTAAAYIDHHGRGYGFRQIDYLTGTSEVVASRMIALVPSRGRTEAAYYMGGKASDARPQTIDVHQGAGELVLGIPGVAETPVIELDPESTPSVILPTDVFYFLRNATRRNRGVFVASSLYEGTVNWSELETELKPGEVCVTPPERARVAAPIGFLAALQPPM